VSAIQEVDPQMVAAQIDAIVNDIRPDAVKTGMLASASIIKVVVDKIREHSLANVVVDPVMVAKSGDRLLQEAAVQALRHDLLPLAAVVTPNLPEAEVLTGKAIESDEDVREAAQALIELGAGAAVVKGGHRSDQEHAIDVLYDGARFHVFSAPRIDTTSTHGTGCTFASAIAAFLALGNPLPEAVGLAKAYLTEALQHAYPLGAGHGPVHHFYRYWQD
jgi:hydroxymethylpyrimidine/phosphomethylpyrimidine kinase